MVKWKFWEKSIGDIPLSELKTERAVIEKGEEKRFLAKIDAKEAEKRRLLKNGAEEPSTRRKRVLARQIMRVEGELVDIEDQHRDISRKICLLDKLTRVKEREKIIKEKGLWKTVEKMTPEELDDYVRDLLRDKIRHEDKIEALLGPLDQLGESGELSKDEMVVEEIVKLMEEVGESGKVDDGLVKVGEVLKKAEKGEIKTSEETT